jgi:superfamily II DNA or RNA helicase
MSNEKTKKYIDLKINGRLFPSWILKNFKKYKLPEVIRQDNVDPCSIKEKLELRKYQDFVGRYLDFNSPYKDILIYHGLGSGKTATAINIYNILYNYTPDWNVFILIKASLRDDPWMKDLTTWINKDNYKERFNNIIFIHYDSPIADKDFLNKVRQSDSSKKSIYIIDECHNFIRNVYSNINSSGGRRMQTIYDYIIEDKKTNDQVRVACISATPAINEPYEFALLFNLLRPNIFPKSEIEFNYLYISKHAHKIIDDKQKNMFQRRIMGLVSYYYGATPDRFATKSIKYIDLKMTEYHESVYKYFEDYEDALEAKQMKKLGKGSNLYRSYTRQACNFVFPTIDQKITGENRPRPGKFKISEKQALQINEGKKKLVLEKNSEKYINVSKYTAVIDYFINGFIKYLKEIQTNDKKHTIQDDLKTFKDKYDYDFEKFHNDEKNKSGLYNAMYTCSPKMLAIIFNIYKSNGPTIVYSNYVRMEGLEIFKIYLSFFNYSSYNETQGKDNKIHYCEYHGGVNKEVRTKVRKLYNTPENKNGNILKIILISPSGSEGISLNNVRQIHIMEPYWNEVRISQIMGRGIRQCSHKDLPIDQRHVDVYRYKMTRSIEKVTTDQHIEELAKTKDNLINSFLDTIKEVAVDCVLNKNHNMMVNSYKCFQFNEASLFDQYVGPAYKEDIYEDLKIDNGLNSVNSATKKIRVMKIKGVIQIRQDDYTTSIEYWYNTKTGVVYDIDLHYAVGKVLFNKDNLPNKLDKDTYIISEVIDIPSII